MSLLPDAAPLQGVEEAMRGWFSDPTPIANRRPFDESQLRGISNVLRSIGQEPWSRIPRIYVVLRTINQLPLIDDFITQGLNDVWFPFTHHTLPLSLKSQSARSSFIQAQRLVLTKSLDLEKRDGKHRHFSDPNDIPVVKLAELGRGGFGIVEKVLSTISREEYARKLILRGPTFRKNKEILREFEAELAILKRLSHAHIVELVGSYTDPRYVGLLMSPVADCNLKEYLDMPVSVDRRSLLRTSFGCLVAAVCYLHQSQIRHKDIKPQNILVKDHRVLITDFGISRDWADLGQSTTTGPTVKTPKYCAPEVAAYLPRNSSSDIWSLGCVFLEIWTVLCGRTTEDLNSHLKANGSTSTCYHSNIESVHSWCDSLVNESSDHDIKRPETWISMMLQIEQHKRCNAQGLFNDIVEYSKEPETQLSFVGLCCTEYEDSAESVQSSVYEPCTGESTTEDTSILDETLVAGVDTLDLRTRDPSDSTQNVKGMMPLPIAILEPKPRSTTPSASDITEIRVPPSLNHSATPLRTGDSGKIEQETQTGVADEEAGKEGLDPYDPSYVSFTKKYHPTPERFSWQYPRPPPPAYPMPSRRPVPSPSPKPALDSPSHPPPTPGMAVYPGTRVQGNQGISPPAYPPTPKSKPAESGIEDRWLHPPTTIPKTTDNPEDRHKDSIYEVAITTSHIITASRDQTLRVWLRSTHRLVCAPLKGHTASVLCVVAHEPANLILSGGSDRCLIAWDLLTYNRKVIVVDAHADSILCLAISDRIVGTGSKDKTIKIWDTGKLSSPSGRRDITPIATLEGHTGAVNAIVMTHDTIISVSGDRAIRVWDLATFQCTRVIGGYHERGIATLTLLPDRVSIACGSKDGTVRIFSFRTGVEEACLREHSGLVRAICNISDRAPLGPIPFTIASGGYDGSVVIWQKAREGLGQWEVKKRLDVGSVLWPPDDSGKKSGKKSEKARVYHLQSQGNILYCANESNVLVAVDIR